MSSETEFKKVYNEFYPKILKYLSRIAGEEDAEDVAQTVFEKISQNLDDFKGDSKLSTWIYRIATNTTIDKMRSSYHKHASRQKPLDDISNAEDKNIWTRKSKTSTDQKIIKKEMQDCIREFIERLPQDYKTVLTLKDLEGFTNSEIAEILQACKTLLDRHR